MEQTLVRKLFQWVENNALLSGFVVSGAGFFPLIILGLTFIFTLLRARANMIRVWGEVLLSVVLSRLVLTEGTRLFFDRLRPFEVLQITPLIGHDFGYAFPSGHAAFYFAIAFSLLFNRAMLKTKIPGWIYGAVMIIAATINGFSRVAAGVHWPSDIIGGALFGLIGAALANKILEKRWTS